MAFTLSLGFRGGYLDGGAPREFYVLYHSFTVSDANDEHATQQTNVGWRVGGTQNGSRREKVVRIPIPTGGQAGQVVGLSFEECPGWQVAFVGIYQITHSL